MHVNVQNWTRTTLPLRAAAVSRGELIQAVALPSADSSFATAELSIGCSGCCQERNMVNLPVASATAVALRNVRRSESRRRDIGESVALSVSIAVRNANVVGAVPLHQRVVERTTPRYHGDWPL